MSNEDNRSQVDSRMEPLEVDKCTPLIIRDAVSGQWTLPHGVLPRTRPPERRLRLAPRANQQQNSPPNGSSSNIPSAGAKPLAVWAAGSCV